MGLVGSKLKQLALPNDPAALRLYSAPKRLPCIFDDEQVVFICESIYANWVYHLSVQVNDDHGASL